MYPVASSCTPTMIEASSLGAHLKRFLIAAATARKASEMGNAGSAWLVPTNKNLQQRNVEVGTKMNQADGKS